MALEVLHRALGRSATRLSNPDACARRWESLAEYGA